ncbi:MAG: J domain-containing protein [Alphaproteobacteria bacterium]
MTSDRPPELANGRKHSYTVPCGSAFRDEVTALARKRGVNVADLTRSVVLVVAADVIAAFPDPGGPAADDRETVVLKSGKAKGTPWRRKPRLQVRMTPGYEIETLRRALGLALAVDRGEVDIRLDGFDSEPEPNLTEELHDELLRLRSMISTLSFEPLAEGIRSRNDALHVMGFAPGSLPDDRTLKSRFRTLATIHHPDSEHGNHSRMSQLNEAMSHLKRGAA